MVVVAVGLAPADAARVPKAFGFLKAPGARERILGASFPSCLNPGVVPEGHFLMNVFVGGGADPTAIDLDDDEIRAVVEKDLSTIFRGPVKPDMLSIRDPDPRPRPSGPPRRRAAPAHPVRDPPLGLARDGRGRPLVRGAADDGVGLEASGARRLLR
jgi:hypothetical protein